MEQFYEKTFQFSAAIQFSPLLAGHEAEKLQQAKDVYGSYYSSAPMGHNFQVTLVVKPQSQKQMPILIQQLSDWLDHTHLNELEYFSKKIPTYERVALAIFDKSKQHLKQNLVSVVLKVTDNESVLVLGPQQITVIKKYKINCVHRHHNPDLSDQENLQLYGKCSGVHGHEYKIEVGVQGALGQNGLVMSWDELDKNIEKTLIDKYDKTYLNQIMGNTSGELIGELFFKELKSSFSSSHKVSLTLRETKKNSFYKV